MVPPYARIGFALGVFAWLAAGVCHAENAGVPRLHPWGAFKPGAWKQIRIVIETLDEQGEVTGVRRDEHRITLTAKDESGLTLLIEAEVDVAGKRIPAEPQCVQQDYHGTVRGAEIEVKEPQEDHVTIDGRKIPVEVRQTVQRAANRKTVAKVYASQTVWPHVLRREAVTTDPEGENQSSETTMSVVALDLPWKVLAEIKSAALVHRVQKHAKGRIDTWEVTAADVPGGVVTHASKELDANGRLLRRSALELVDYGTEPQQEAAGLFPRLRSMRPRRSR